jgi:hypothetical protein
MIFLLLAMALSYLDFSITVCMKVVPYVFNYATLILPRVTGNLYVDVEGFNSILIPIDDTTIVLSSTDKISPTEVNSDTPQKPTIDNLP